MRRQNLGHFLKFTSRTFRPRNSSHFLPTVRYEDGDEAQGERGRERGGRPEGEEE
jgi:hypothetical protein